MGSTTTYAVGHSVGYHGNIWRHGNRSLRNTILDISRIHGHRYTYLRNHRNGNNGKPPDAVGSGGSADNSTRNEVYVALHNANRIVWRPVACYVIFRIAPCDICSNDNTLRNTSNSYVIHQGALARLADSDNKPALPALCTMLLELVCRRWFSDARISSLLCYLYVERI